MHHYDDNSSRHSGFDNVRLLKSIKQLLLELGVSPALLGYTYLAQCIYLCVEDHTRIHDLIASVYEVVARINATTYQRVERNIRHAVKVFADRNHVPELNKLLGVRLYLPGDYPSNGELIGYLTEYVLLHFDLDSDD